MRHSFQSTIQSGMDYFDTLSNVVYTFQKTNIVVKKPIVSLVTSPTHRGFYCFLCNSIYTWWISCFVFLKHFLTTSLIFVCMGTKTQLILYPIICDDQVNDQQISSIKPGNGQSPLIFMWKPPLRSGISQSC